MNHPRDLDPENYSLGQRYLRLPRDYADALGGVRWSDRLEGLTLGGERLLIGYEELAEFLEGYVSQEPLAAFGFVLHWALFFQEMAADHVEQRRLSALFREARRPWRNAGALAAAVGADLPPPSVAAPVDMICHRLRDRTFAIHWYTGAFNGAFPRGEEPPLSPGAFERRILGRLHDYGDADLRAWLSTGRGPVRHAGEKLAQEKPPPRTLGQVLAELLQRPRLAGTEAYVPQMVSALSLPPRRRVPQQLPLGGYADVSTRGGVEQLLLSQYALEELDFLRRFAEHELLYFRREEPPAATKHELVVLLDQGVRAWGDVRLALTAAAVALTQEAGRKKQPLALAFTSNHGRAVDPLGTSPSELGRLLESSDLSLNPGDALEGVLQRPGAAPRDVLLLSHPASLREDDVRAAARRLPAADRLFALTLSPRGQAELAELRRGLPVRLRSFRVDFTPARTPQAKATPLVSSWTGPLEPIGWPFRLGNESPVQLFDFDGEGRRLIAVMENSLIFAWDLEATSSEILPRPWSGDRPRKHWLALVGVANGFVLLGHEYGKFVLYHYDFGRCDCTAHHPGGLHAAPADLYYLAQYHAVVLVDRKRAAELAREPLEHHGGLSLLAEATFTEEVANPVLALDLATGEYSTGANASTRAFQAWLHWRKTLQGRRVVEPVAEGEASLVKGMTALANLQLPQFRYMFHSETAWLQVGNSTGGCRPVPQTDGKPTLAGAKIHQVQFAGTTLAVQFTRASSAPWLQGAPSLLFFQCCPEANFLRELTSAPAPGKPEPFILSPDGSRVAVRRAGHRLEVQHTNQPGRLLMTRAGTAGKAARLWVGDEGFLVACGRRGHAWHLVEWTHGVLELHSEIVSSTRPEPFGSLRHPRVRAFLNGSDPVEVTAGEAPPALKTDPERWVKGLQRGRGFFMLDRFGQVAVFGPESELVFMFLGHGDSWSAWMPDGTRYGIGMLHTWPNSADALVHMGRALAALTGAVPT